MNLLPIVNKARRIYDLNNVPLVQGASHIKWSLPHSMHSEHKGRTPKCPIANHRVEYAYAKAIPVRLSIDKSNALTECPIEFEVMQEFSSPSTGPAATALHAATTARSDERITLGRLTLNLAEYVEESEVILRETGYRVRAAAAAAAAASAASSSTTTPQGHSRKKSSLSTTAPLLASTADDASDDKQQANPSITETPATPDPDASPAQHQPQQQPQQHRQHHHQQVVEDGVVRRYLMADSKINSTLKIGILMIQQDGERNFVAPPLKSAPVFGGIAGMNSSNSNSSAANGGSAVPTAAGDFGMHFQDTHTDHAEFTFDNSGANSTNKGAAAAPSLTKSHDAYESQDVYRRALAASWASQPGDLTADEVIEDIFAGGDGFGPAWEGGDDYGGGGGGGGGGSSDLSSSTTPRGHHKQNHSTSSSTLRRDDSLIAGGGDSGFRAVRAAGAGAGARAKRQGSGETLKQQDHHHQHRGGNHQHHHKRDGSKDSRVSSSRMSRSGSLASLTGTMDSERGRGGFKSVREVTESEVREDMIAWTLPGAAAL